MRLIDADALLAEAMVDGAYGYVDAKQIADAPTIDAVPVVRCKDCKHSRKDDVFHTRWCQKPGSIRVVKDEFYCAYGERKDE